MSIYSCKVWGWQPYQNLRTDQSTNSTSTSANPEFLIDVFATYVTVDDDDPSIFTSLHRRNFQFMAQRQVLIDNATSWSTISGMLSHMLVPFHAQPSMIQKISTSAQEFAARPGNVDLESIRLVVTFVVEREENAEEEGEVSNSVAAQERASSCAATRVLRRASIEGYCAICLEEILLECEASRLPCLHFYHERCILRWLEKSNLCPLCRFELHLD